jgi:hypothetical protein
MEVRKMETKGPVEINVEDFNYILRIKTPRDVFKEAKGMDLISFSLDELKTHWPRFRDYVGVERYSRDLIEFEYGEIERIIVYDDRVEIKTVEYIITVSGRNGGEFTVVHIPVKYNPSILCRIGIHRWRYYGEGIHLDSMVGLPYDKEHSYRRCLRCGKDQWYAYYRNQGGDRIGIGWRDKDVEIKVPLVR